MSLPELRPENAGKWVGETSLEQTMQAIKVTQRMRDYYDRCLIANPMDIKAEAGFAAMDDKLFELRRAARALVIAGTGYTVDELNEAGL